MKVGGLGDGRGGLNFRDVAAHAIKVPGRVDIGPWAGKEPEMRKWLVDHLIPEGSVTTLYGDGGIGKSILGVQLLVACALERQWVGRTTRACKALAVFCEDSEDELHRRFHAACGHHGADPGDLVERLELFCRPGLDNSLVSFRDPWGPGEPTEFLGQLHNLAIDHGAELIVLDSLHDFFTGNEVSRTQARQFIGELNALARECRGAVVLIAHPSLSGLNTGSGTSGSTAWSNAVRSRLYLTSPSDDEDAAAANGLRVLKTMKANYAGHGDAIRLRWQDGVFVPEAAPGEGGGMVASLERGRLDKIFLACLDAVLAQGRAASDSRNAGNYAPKVFAKMPQAAGAKAPELEAAMARLFAAKAIRMGECGKRPNRHPLWGIVRDLKTPRQEKAAE
jgi:RecA-family ATPase